MKVPNKISTLYELRDWVEKRNPKSIDITDKCGLHKMKEFQPRILVNQYGWTDYRGIPIKYK